MMQVCPSPAPQLVEDLAVPGDTCAVIVAGGSGERFGDPRGKLLVDVAGLPVASWSLMAFGRAPSIGAIVLVCPEDAMGAFADEGVAPITLSVPVMLVAAGKARQDSARAGVHAVPTRFSYVAIHDAARPLVTVEAIEASCARVREDVTLAGAVCGQPSIDTLKLVEDGVVVATPDRSVYWCAQTPQVFRCEAARAAHEAARKEGYVGTDDASLVERMGGRVAMVAAQRDNIKLTVPEDLTLVEAVLHARLSSAFADEGGR
ncbi:MAG: 2-C-methyl-D-erythritol 4-phosphate cytidylyltransferase [Atopobiaceae bacterium]|nr:2-C-methyl-D-erythritol 4-phosphate cytidylyltransferase [Atopobiaceae bacterium]